MSMTTADDVDELSPDDAPIEVVRELEEELTRIAETDLPFAPHAQTALDRLKEAETDA